MSPAVSQVLAECEDSVVIFSHDAERPFLCSLSEAAQRGPELSAKGYRLAGCLATAPDGDIVCIPEPGHEATCWQSFADFLLSLSKKPESAGDELAWLEALGRLEDPR